MIKVVLRLLSLILTAFKRSKLDAREWVEGPVVEPLRLRWKAEITDYL